MRAPRRIKTLGVERLSIIDNMLARGDGTPTVAKYIQKEMGALTDMTEAALAKMLLRYRTEELHDKVLTGIVQQGVVSFVKQIDILDEMTNAVMIQRDRMHKVYAKEKDTPMVMDAVSKAISQYTDMLGKLANLQFEIGMMQRAPKVTTGVAAISPPANEADPTQVVFKITEARERIMDAVEALDFELLN